MSLSPTRALIGACVDGGGDEGRQGVDPQAMEGGRPQAVSEVGVDMSRWNSEKQFASWLGLCPDNRISGGKVRKRGTRHVVSRASTALPGRGAAEKSKLTRPQVPPPPLPPRGSQSHHCHGASAGPADLPHA